MSQETITDLTTALASCKRSFVSLAVFSLFTNILALTPMFYIMNVFDKAVSTGSIETLALLALIACAMYVGLALLEWVRGVVLVYVADRLDKVLAPRIFDICFQRDAGLTGEPSVGAKPLADFNSLRQFLGGSSIVTLLDLMWVPVLLTLMVFFHPAIFIVALVCIAIMVTVLLLNQKLTTPSLEAANEKASNAVFLMQNALKNSEAASALGMMDPLRSRWRKLQDEMLDLQVDASSKASAFTGVTKTLGMAMQSVAITTGALLVIYQEISPGVMIAASMLLAKTLMPIQSAVSTWPAIVNARQNWQRINDLCKAYQPENQSMPLPEITGEVEITNAVVVPPGGSLPTLLHLNLHLKPSSITAVIGPSAAGKSSLVRSILGLWPVGQGAIRIDSARANQYSRAELGPQVGYLPQEIELFDGTVAENIARLGDIQTEDVIQAARDAGAHELILKLPNGYDTAVSASKGALTPGQKQRIALARALYRRPKLLVLDEPDSNLDDAGNSALLSALETLKAHGATILVVSHRKLVLKIADNIVLMRGGRIVKQGPRSEFNLE